jgi:queuine/archaeosine tRNA-ribosyltransferase
MTAARLVTLHNLAFYARLVEEARASVSRGDYGEWANSWLRGFRARDAALEV